MVLSPDSECVYLIDFGFAERYMDEFGVHKNEDHSNFKGNRKYAGINSCNFRTTSRRDDIQSILFLLTDMLLGKLPWENLMYLSTSKFLRRRAELTGQHNE